MEKTRLAYGIYMLVLLALVGAIVATPILAFGQDMGFSYDAFGPTCHQKLSRSLCLFSDGAGYWLDDCTPQEGAYIGGKADREFVRVLRDGTTGYKLPVCTRDVALYAALLLGGALYPLVRDIKDKSVFPSIFLILAIVPLALDGGIQFASDAGFISIAYESTNLTRIITGAIAGIGASFFAIPILMNMFSRSR